MSLKAFSFPFPETRYFKVNGLIYKFSIRGATSYSGKGVTKDDSFHHEMEEIIRTVFGNLDHLQPFSSEHFIVFPYKKRRGKTHEHGETKLKVYPFTVVLYMEKHMQRGKNAATKEVDCFNVTDENRVWIDEFKEDVSQPCSKRRRSDSPLEEDILKDLIKDMEAESKLSVTETVDLSLGDGRVHDDPALVDEPETMTDTEKEEETPERPGILKRLASHIFPSFFRSTTD